MLIKECWDTCLFLSYLNDAPEEKDKVEIIEALLHQCQSPKSDRMIVISTIVLAEVQPRNKYNQDRYDIVRELFYTARPYFKRQALTPKIADVASRIRSKHKVRLADAINIATAALEPCSVLYTYDGSGAKPDSYDIIPLDGIVVAPGIPPLHIAIPTRPPQYQLTMTPPSQP